MTSTTRTPLAGAGVDALLIAAAAAIVPLVQELSIGFTIFYLTAIGWRYAARWDFPQPGRIIRWSIAAIGVFLVIDYHGSLLGRDAGVALLVWLTALKLLELGSLRDAMLATFLSMLVLLGGFLYQSTLLLGVYALIVVVVFIAAMVRLQQPSLEWRANYRLATALLIQALPIMLVAYLTFPRLPSALWGVPIPSGQAQTGMPEQMRPGNITSLVPSYEIAFRAQFDGAPPLPRDHYWRVFVLWDTDGREWTRGERVLARDVLIPRGEPVSYRLVLEPSPDRWIPVLDVPSQIPNRVLPRAGFVYEQLFARRERQNFRFTSVTRYETGPMVRHERQRALALAPSAASERVRALAHGWRATHAQDRDIVRNALAYFREQPFFYTLTPPAYANDPVDEFLFEGRRGFCEHYASAFVTLMRAAGVPSRVVLGYQGGIYNPTGNYLIVRQADAHAWAEVWYENGGWTRVDPTAAVAPARVEYGIDGVQRLTAESLSLTDLGNDTVRRAIEWGWIENAWWRAQFAWDYANISWYYWVTDYRRERQSQLLERLGITRGSVVFVAVVVLQLLLLYALFTWRARRPREATSRLYDLFCRKLAGVGIRRAPHEGPHDFAARARRGRPDLGESIDTITRAYVALRYGKISRPHELGAMARAVHKFRPAKRH